MEYLIFFAVVLGVNLMPAFGPPTWSIIALYTLNGEMETPLLVLTGALAAALGRYALAHATRHLGTRWLSAETQANLAAAREALERRKRNTVLGLGLFALSPVPSAQLFEAAGLACVRLLPFTAAFFAGRLVSYSIYAFTAEQISATSLGETFREEMTSPLGIALQVAMIALLVVLARVDWARRLGLNTRRGESEG
ncbi:hypothetical protein N0B51_12760 [Tsuneonella sp. YG55]|uniref:SNARE associated Golgi protein n=1 Tax=Tsuneonella litorea TaxID=2976475 RepID=A0A9X3AM00_9SPHN|nr:hypothetical protein [Tsuneonella litorea]MCT2559848.1 hypothetical protein [Tsuneonella litorea]